MKLADDFPTTSIDLRVIDSLNQNSTEIGFDPHPGIIEKIAVYEALGWVYDFTTGDRFTPTHAWQPFVNFWMDSMWRQRKQANYVKLALVMQSIAQRDGDLVAQADTFDVWCELAKWHQNVYFKQSRR